MRRWLLPIFPVPSLLLSLGFVALLVRGWYVEDSLTHLSRSVETQQIVSYTNAPGQTRIGFGAYSRNDLAMNLALRGVPEGWSRQSMPRQKQWSWFDLGYRQRASADGALRYTDVTFPTWLAALLFGVPPLLPHIRRALRQRRRRRSGRCVWCGHDLTGNVSGVCPECWWGQP